MIKIFGKERYHWQPEASWLVIYWSLALIPIFLSMALVYEQVRLPYLIFFLFGLFLILLMAGFHRYFIITEEGEIRIISMDPIRLRRIDISHIQRVDVTKSGLTFILADHPDQVFSMRKWPKKYFLDALAINPYFTGEVDLVDDHILDYFALYAKSKEKRPLTRQAG